jgi:uncharacterized protein (DUF885 family)
MIETSRSFKALREEFVEVTLRHDPVAATMAGIHDYDHQLPNDSPEGFRDRIAWLRDFEQRVDASVSEGELDAAERVDRALLKARIAAIRCDLENIRTHTHNPARYPETALRGVFLLMARSFAPPDERKEAALARLMAIPDYLDAARANLEQVPEVFVGLASEITMTGPAFVDEVTRALLRGFAGEAERIEHAGERARMGFLRFQNFVDHELRKRAAGTFAIGESWMNWKLEREHLLAMDCAALEQFGWDEIARVGALLEDEARKIDPRRSWREQVAAAKRRHPEALRLRDAYEAEVERARRFVEDRRLAPIPDGKLEIIDTPVFERAITPYAAYLPPAPFDSEQTGCFFVTPVDPSRPREEQEQQLEGHCYAGLPLTVLHESYPGHHLQLLHSNRCGSRLRRLAESSVFAEGWALYCEELMYEQGFFADPVTRLFQLKDLLWRACRVVIDVQLHTGRMSLEQAVEFQVDRAMLERVNAVAEVKAYAQNPTQPMSYLVGKKMLLEMRDEARRRAGWRFNLHDFHAALLASGTVPPALVREELWNRFVMA